ncbi:hypothetical protein C8Q78DRAFT_468898 [Trametes maxima]|nr:hypothetical protein C8Q78DRAFT_468898 [Trametes maxima]
MEIGASRPRALALATLHAEPRRGRWWSGRTAGRSIFNSKSIQYSRFDADPPQISASHPERGSRRGAGRGRADEIARSRPRDASGCAALDHLLPAPAPAGPGRNAVASLWVREHASKRAVRPVRAGGGRRRLVAAEGGRGRATRSPQARSKHSCQECSSANPCMRAHTHICAAGSGHRDARRHQNNHQALNKPDVVRVAKVTGALYGNFTGGGPGFAPNSETRRAPSSLPEYPKMPTDVLVQVVQPRGSP